MHCFTHSYQAMKPFFIGLFIIICSFSAIAAIEVYDFDSPSQELQFQELTQTIRCPKCQNNTISDSNAELAQDLRYKVYEMTKKGRSKEQIIDYMVGRYGNFVTYDPPMTSSTAVLWIAPILVLCLGFGLIVQRYLKNNKELSCNAFSEWDDEKEVRLNQLLNDDPPLEQKNGERK